jgi:CelD/BcsL family acetyltransferase involved in cellulose biosynthesis
VLPLPESVDAYLASLGKNTRRNLRRYMDKLKRSHPSFRFEIFDKEAVCEEHVRAIIELNRTRISGKNMSFGINSEIDRIVALTKACGMVGVATIDGRICGGTIGYMAGKNYFFKVIAHDPQYNEFSAGILCCYLAISECIARGCEQFNFMWNEYEYKFALGAAPRELAHFAIYRSRLHMLRQARHVVSLAADGYRHKVSSLLEKTGREDQLSGSQRLAFHALDGLRRVKRMMTGGRGR